MNVNKRKTRKCLDVPGDAHFLTFSTFQRLPLLTKEITCRWMAEAIDLSRSKNAFDLWAWVIMPEHVHLVVCPQPETKISSILATMKTSVSRRAIQWLKLNSPEFLVQIKDTQPNGKSSYRFWQRGGGYDRNLRSVRDIHEKIFYVHQNPVVRGLVSKSIDYPWSSAKSWECKVDSPLKINRETLPSLTILDDSPHSKLMQ